MRFRLPHGILLFAIIATVSYWRHDPRILEQWTSALTEPSRTTRSSPRYEQRTSPQINQQASRGSDAKPESSDEAPPEDTADETLCSAQLMNGDGPVISQSMRRKTTLLCYEGYVALYSALSRTPVWSAEKLTPARVEAAHEIERVNPFHPDPNLPVGDRSELNDYTRSGWDRGHMSPNGDMSTVDAQFSSFSLGNMVPQFPENNRVIWAHIEEAVRKWTRSTETVYVVTGPVFSGDHLQSLRGRVLIPTHIFKAVWDPVKHKGGVFITFNIAGEEMLEQSFSEFTAWSGLDPFPDLTPAEKAQAPALPAVRSHQG